MASVIMATVPVVTLILAALHRQERLSANGIIGGVLAILGIAVLSLRSIEGDLPILSMLLVLGASFGASESSVIIKGFPQQHPIAANSVGMAVGATLLLATSLAFGEQWKLPEQGKTWIALSWLIVAGSVALFVLFLYVIRRWTASASVYALTLMPVVAVTLAAALAGEPVTLEVLIGGAIVLAGVYVGALRGARRGRQAPALEQEKSPA